MDKINQLKALLNSEEFNSDCEKFFNKGNKASVARIRKVMQEVKTLAQEIRVEVQELKNSK